MTESCVYITFNWEKWDQSLQSSARLWKKYWHNTVNPYTCKNKCLQEFYWFNLWKLLLVNFSTLKVVSSVKKISWNPIVNSKMSLLTGHLHLLSIYHLTESQKDLSITFFFNKRSRYEENNHQIFH